jgi:hypothetical protein
LHVGPATKLRFISIPQVTRRPHESIYIWVYRHQSPEH